MVKHYFNNTFNQILVIFFTLLALSIIPNPSHLYAHELNEHALGICGHHLGKIPDEYFYARRT